MEVAADHGQNLCIAKHPLLPSLSYMDRTAEFLSVVDIFLHSGEEKAIASVRRPKPASSSFLLSAVAVFEQLKQNDELVQSVNRL